MIRRHRLKRDAPMALLFCSKLSAVATSVLKRTQAWKALT